MTEPDSFDNPTDAGFDRGAYFEIDAAMNPQTLAPGVSFKGFGQSIVINSQNALELGLKLMIASEAAMTNTATVRAMQANGIKKEVAIHIVQQGIDIRHDLDRIIERGAHDPGEGKHA